MRQFIFALLAISLTAGCTTTRTHQPISANSAERIEPGQSVVIEYADGSSEKVEIRHYSADHLEVVADDTARSIHYADIKAIHETKLDADRTVGIGAIGIGAILLLGYVVSNAGLPVGGP